MNLLSIYTGYALDLIIGDPYSFPHPVRYIGKLISSVEKQIRKITSSDKGLKIAGFFLWFIVVGATFGITTLVLQLFKFNKVAYFIVNTILIYTTLATKCLKDESVKIYKVLKTGDLEKSSFSNIEQQSLEFVKYTLDPWIIRWEQSLNRSLLNPDEKKTYFFKFNVEGLLRGDYQSRMQGYATARQNGWMSANDIRELENLDKIPAEEGGDLYLINGNMLPLNNAGAYANKQEKEEEADEEVLELDKGTKQRNGRKSTRT